jgi:carbamoyltransferase
MDVLGVSCYFHDAAAAILRDGQLLAAAEEERFSRVKHDYGFPRRAIQFCLREAGIRGADLDYAVFFEKPFRKFDRILMSVLAGYPGTCGVFRESMTAWLIDKLWVASTLENELGIAKGKILFSEHHLSHAASAFLCSPFDKAAILTVDGVGEWTTAAWGVGWQSQIQIKKSINFPHSLGLLYSTFTAFLGFEVNEGEYKVMGMAPYGQPRYEDKVWKLVHANADGSFLLDLSYFSFQRSTSSTYSRRFLELFGEPRLPGLPFFTQASGFPSYFGKPTSNFNELCRQNEHYADIAASIQKVTEELLLRMARRVHAETGLKKLCLAGGVALNSVANGRILRETPFEELYIQPSAGDGGGALGAALWAHATLLGRGRAFRMDHCYWGEAFPDGKVDDYLRKSQIPHRRFHDEGTLLDAVVERLTRGEVVGWFHGRAEWGPRALGSRSILADARNAEMRDLVNAKVKFREPYRPFAPSVLAERAEDFFDLPQADRHWPARFMLLVSPVRESKRNVIPATTHVDGSARLHTVFRETSPRYYALLERLGQATGVPVVLNTSFNLKSEPIVNSPSEAFRTFSQSEMDCLVLENCWIEKTAL